MERFPLQFGWFLEVLHPYLEGPLSLPEDPEPVPITCPQGVRTCRRRWQLASVVSQATRPSRLSPRRSRRAPSAELRANVYGFPGFPLDRALHTVRPVALFVVERYLPGVSVDELRSALERLPDAAAGTTVRYLGSTILTEDEACLCHFEAPSAAAVVEVNGRAGVDVDRVVAAVPVVPPLS
jgi:Protein of unknown function (DUF4242)